MNLMDILGGRRPTMAVQDPYNQQPVPIDMESPYAKYALPLAAVIEAIGSKGQGKSVQNQLTQLMGMKEADVGARQAAMERQLGGEKAQREKTFRGAVAKSPEKLSSLYEQYAPEEAGKMKYQSELRLSELLSHPEKLTDLQRKLEELRKAYPDKNDAEILQMALAPGSAFGPSSEKIEGAKKLSESSALGGLTPTVTGAKATQEKAVSEAGQLGTLTPPVVSGEAGKAAAVSEATESAKKTAEAKQAAGGLAGMISSAEMFKQSHPEMLGGGFAGAATRGLSAAGQIATGKTAPAVALDKFMRSNTSFVAKRIQQQVGNLSDRDMKAAEGMVPLSTDPEPVFTAKIDFLKTVENTALTPDQKRQEFDRINTELFGGGAGASTKEPIVNTQTEYDALPSGSYFMSGKTNQRRRKP